VLTHSVLDTISVSQLNALCSEHQPLTANTLSLSLGVTEWPQ
jgi:hypothetical protein